MAEDRETRCWLRQTTHIRGHLLRVLLNIFIYTYVSCYTVTLFIMPLIILIKTNILFETVVHYFLFVSLT
jgi:hypothetical protein